MLIRLDKFMNDLFNWEMKMKINILQHTTLLITNDY